MKTCEITIERDGSYFTVLVMADNTFKGWYYNPATDEQKEYALTWLESDTAQDAMSAEPTEAE